MLRFFKKLIPIIAILVLAGGFALAMGKFGAETAKGNERKLVFKEARQWQIAADATVTTTGSGNWNSTVPDAPWPGGTVPATTDDVVIASGHTVTVPSGYSATAASLTFNAASTANGVALTDGTSSLTITGATTINAPTAAVDATLAVGAGTYSTTDITINGGATTGYNGVVSLSTGTITASGNIVCNTANTAQQQITFTGAGTIDVDGNFASGSNACTLAASTGLIKMNGGAAQVLGDYTTYNNLEFANTLGGVSLEGTTTLAGNFTITSGSVTAPSTTLTIAGNFSNSGTFTHNSGTVDFNKSSATQTLNSGGVGAGKIFNNLTHSGAGTLQLLTNAIDVDGNFSQTAGIFDANSLSQNYAGNFSLSVGTTYTKGGTLTFDGATQVFTDSTVAPGQDLGAVTIGPSTATSLSTADKMHVTTLTSGTGGNDTFDISGDTLTISGTGTPFTQNGTFTVTGSTVVYDGTGATNITSTAYNNLNLGGSATTTTYTAAGDITASGVLTIVSSSGTNTFDASNRIITLSGTGTPFIISSSEVFTPSTSIISYTGNGATNIAATTYNTLNIGTANSANVTYTALGNITANNNVNLQSAAATYANTFDLDNYNLTVGLSSVANSGGISVPIRSIFNQDGGTTTVKSSASGSATIGGAGTTTFNNLSFLPDVASAPTFTLGSAASQIITVNGVLTVGNGTNAVTVNATTNDPTLAVSGDFSVAASGTFVASDSASFTVGGSWNVNSSGTFTHSGGTVTFGSGWSYRKALVLSGVNLTDYQVKFTVYQGNGTDDNATNTVYCNGKCRAAGASPNGYGDIRFTDASGNQLYYWIEDPTASPAIVWVKVPTIVSGGTTIYMLYGNAGASTTMSGANTFSFFDDFNTLDSSVWQTDTGSPTISSGILTVPPQTVIKKIATNTRPIIIDARARWSGLTTAGYWVAFGFGLNTNLDRSVKFFTLNNLWYIGTYDGTETKQSVTDTTGAYHNYTYKIGAGASALFYTDYVQTGTEITTNIDTGINILFFRNHEGASSGVTLNMDNIRVRKYAATEPTKAWGSESANSTWGGGASKTVNPGGSSFNNLTFNSLNDSWSFGANPATVAGNFTITAGSVTAPSSGASTGLTIAGNYSNSGTFTHNSGTVTFNGTGAQSITGATTWNNLTINNTYASPDDTNDVDPSAAQTVTGTLTVTDGQWTPYTGDSYANVSIGAAGIMKPDASSSIAVSGNWTNSGAFTANSGTVTFGSGWSYKKAITLTASGSTLAYYQVRVDVYSGAGTDGSPSNEDVYCNSNCKSDFGDIRFIDASGAPIDYWMEGSTSPATFWVEVPSISTGGTTIYMLYGNAGASTTSNGANTFEFFDDFNGDLSKWTVRASMSIITGELDMPSNADSDVTPTFSNNLFGSSYVYEFKAKITSGSRMQPIPAYIRDFTVYGAYDASRYISGVWGPSSNIYLEGFFGQSPPPLVGSVVTIDSTYHKWKIIRKPTSLILYVDDSIVGTEKTINNAYNTSTRIAISGHTIAAKWDDVRVRQYAATEPTKAWGSETTRSLSGTMTGGSAFNNLTFNDSGGAWSFGANSATVAGNLTITAGSVTTNAALEVDGIYTVSSSGTYTAAANADLTLKGNAVLENGSTFTKASGTGKFILEGDAGTETFNDQHTTKVDLGNVQIGLSPGTTTLASDMTATSLTINASDTLITNGYDLDIGTGGITINSTGTLNTTYTDGEVDRTTITDEGNFTNNGTFTYADSTVTIDGSGTSQLTYSASTTFYNLTENASAGKIIEFDESAGVKTIIAANGSFNFQGGDCTTGRIYLRSIGDANDDWEIDASASGVTTTVKWVDLQWSKATAALTADASTDEGDANFNWTITNSCIASSVRVSGTVYKIDETTAFGASYGAGTTVQIKTAGTTTSATVMSDGTFSKYGITTTDGGYVLVYLDGGTYHGSAVTIAPTVAADITSLNIFENALAAHSHKTGTAITNANIIGAESGDPDDLIGNASSGSNLIVDSGYEFHIAAGKSYTPGGALTTQGAGGNLHLSGTGATANFEANNATISGNVTIDTGATLTAPNASASTGLTIAGNYSNSGTFTHNSGTVDFNKSSATQTLNSGGVGAGKIFNNLTHSGAGTLQLLTNAIDVDGNFSQTAGIFDANSLSQNYAGNFSLSAGTTYTKGGILTFDGATQVFTDSTAAPGQDLGAVTIGPSTVTSLSTADKMHVTTLTSGTGGNDTFDISGDTLTISGTGTPFTQNGTFTVTGSTVVYDGTGATNITSTAYNNLNLGGSATTTTYTASGDITASGVLTIVSSSGTNTFDASNRVITLSGTGTPFITNSEALTEGTSTFVYSGVTTATNITAETYYNLNLGGSATTTTYTAAGDITASGVLTIVSSSGTNTFDASNRVITLSGTGTPFIISSSEVFTPSTSIISYTGNGATNIASATYYTLNIGTANSANVTYTALGNITANNNINLQSAAATYANTFDLDNYNLTVGLSSVANSGGISVPIRSTFNQDGGTTTVKSSASGSATIGGAGTSTFYDLVVGAADSLAYTFNLGGPITVSNDLTIAATGTHTLDTTGSNHAITVSGDWTNSGAFTANSGTVTFGSGWSYKKKITLTGATLTDYQIRVDVYSGSGTDGSPGNEDVYCNNNCQSDFDDVRFTDASGAPLYYWRENATSPAIFWVKTSTLTAGTDIYMLYGNAGAATTTSNGVGTFPFYVDAENYTLSNPIGQDGWTAAGGTSGDWNVVNTVSQAGQKSIKLTSTYSGYDSITKSLTMTFPLEAVSWVRFETNGRAFVFGLAEGANSRIMLGSDNNLFSGNFAYHNGASWVNTGISPSLNAWYKLKIIAKTTTTADYYVYDANNSLLYSGTDKAISSTITSGIDSIGLTGGHVSSIQYYDSLFIRKYASPEPTKSGWTDTTRSLSGTMTGGSAFNNLTFNDSGGAWSFGANPATVAGNLTITAGTVTAPSAAADASGGFKIAGNYSNNGGTFTHNSGTVTFNGSVAQAITTNSQIFNNLTINNTGADGTTADDITISGALNIGGAFIVTDGQLRLDTNNPAVYTAGDISIASAGSITKGTGAWTFYGSTTAAWTDSTSGGQDLGAVNINSYDSGLVGKWKLDGGTSGSIANNTTIGFEDISGNGNNGTAKNTNGTGMAWTTGPSGIPSNGGAVTFDGVDDYISIPDGSSVDITGSGSFSAWIYPTALSAYNTILGKRDVSAIEDNYHIRTSGASDELDFLFSLSGAWRIYTTTNADLAINNWYLITVAYDQSTVKIYKNGQLLSGSCTNGTCTGALQPDNNTLGIGRPGDYTSQYFTGKIDDVRIYSRALSQLEIANLYSSKTVSLGTATSAKATSFTIAANQTFSLNGANTLTLTGTGTPFVVSGTFTPSTGTVAYTGNGATNIASTTYHSLNIGTSNSANITYTALGNITANNNINLQSAAATYANTFSMGNYNLIVGSSSVSNSGGISVPIRSIFTQSGGTTTVKSSASGSATIGGAGTTTFNNLSFLPDVASAPTFTLGSAASQIITVNGVLTVGNGTNAVTVNATTNDPTLAVSGDFSVAASGTFVASDSASFTVGGSWNVNSSGTFTHSGGTVTFGSGWSYKKALVLSGVNLTDYQVKFTVYQGNGTDDNATNTVYCNGKCRAAAASPNGYGDIRFTDASGNQLYYWIEDPTASPAIIWVKTTIVSGGTTIYMLYGNSAATTTSSGANTFLFFDDFLGGTLDPSKWTGSATLSGGIATVSTSATHLSSILKFGTNTAAIWRTSVGSSSLYASMGYWDTSVTKLTGFYVNHENANVFNCKNHDTVDNSVSISALSGYNNLETIRNGSTNTICRVNYTNTTTNSNQLTSSALNLDIFAQSQNVLADWVLVRQYAATEPTKLWGNETANTWGGGASKTITPGGSSFNNLTFNSLNDSWSFGANSATVAGNFTITAGSVTTNAALEVDGIYTVSSSGTYTAAANADLTLKGNAVLENGSTFTKATGTGKFILEGDGGTETFSDQHTTKVDLGAVQIGLSPGTTTLTTDMTATSLTINASDTLITNGYDLDIGTGGITINSTGTLNATYTDGEADRTTITDEGNFTNNGTFTYADSTVTIDGSGTSQLTYSANTTFYNLTENASAGKIIEFDESAGVKTIIAANGSFNFQGADCTTGRIYLRSIGDANDDWEIDASASGVTTTVKWVDLQWSKATTALTADASTDEGDANFNWTITNSCIASSIRVSGTVYKIDETTAFGASYGAGTTVQIKTAGTTTSATVMSDGSYSKYGITTTDGGYVLVYLDGGTYHGSAVTIAPTVAADIASLNIFENALAAHSHKTGTAITNANIIGAESGDPDDLIGNASSGSNLIVDSGYEFHVAAGENYVPGGTLTTQGAGGNLHLGGTGATANFEANNATISGNAAIDTGATLTAPNASASTGLTIAGNYSNAGTFTHNSGTVTMSSVAGGSTITPGGSSFSTLTFSNTSGTDTAGGAITAITLNTTAGGTLNMSTYDLGVTNVANNGTIRTQSTSATPLTTGKTWDGTVQYDAASAQSVVAGTYNILNIGTANSANVTYTALGNITANNNVNLQSAAATYANTFDLDNYNLTVGSASVANSGGIAVPIRSTFNQDGGTTTVKSSASGSATIGGAGTTTFWNLTVGTASDNITYTFNLGGAIAVSNDLTITAGGTGTHALDVTATNYGITVGGSWTNNSTFTKQGGTVTFGSGWSYKKAITLTASGSSLNNYQVKVIANAGNGTDGTPADNVYCGTGHCRTDAGYYFGDVRFTDSSGAPIDYWMETSSASAATFWVEVPTIATTPGTVIYMLYGNSAASTTMSGANTFSFFDDFSGDLSKWSTLLGTPSYSIVGGRLQMVGSTEERAIKGNVSFDTGIIEAKYDANPVSNYKQLGIGFGKDTNNRIWTLKGYRDGQTAEIVWYVASVFNWQYISYTGTTGFLKLSRSGTNTIGYIKQNVGDVWTTVGSKAESMTALYPMIYSYDTLTGYFDDIRVRQYAATEPTKAWGNETANTWGGGASKTITPGGSSFNNLTFNSLNDSWSFGANAATVAGNLTLTAGTVTAPSTSGTLTINGNTSVTGTLTASTGTITANNVSIQTGGTIAASTTGTFNVAGNWINSGTFTHNSGTIAFNKSSGTQTLNSGGIGAGKIFNNFTHSGAGTLQLLTNALNVDGTFSQTAGIFDANSLNQNFAGNFTLSSGTIYTKGGTLTFDGTLNYADNTLPKQNIGTVVSGSSPDTITLTTDMSADSLTIPTTDTLITKGYDITLSDYLDCQGTCALNLTDTAPNNEGDGTVITLGGNWTMSGTATFTPYTNSTVVFNDTGKTSVITGSTSFYNLKSITPSKAITFASGSTQTVVGALTLNGGACNTKIFLRSNSAGTAWTLHVDGSSEVSYTDIKDSTATHALTANNSIDSTGNTGWTFASPTCGTTTSPSYITEYAGGSSAGPIGTVLNFDGTNDYLYVNDNAALDQANTFSFSVWIKPDVISIADEYIIYRQDSYYIKKTAPDIIVGGIWYDSVWHSVTSTEIRSVPSKWTHIELVYNKDAGGTDELKLYLNGILTGRGDYSTAIPAAATKLYLGAGDEMHKNNTPENFFDGKIGDLKFYQYARSADEVRVDYNGGFADLLAPVGKDCSADPASCMDYGLAGYWNMDEGGGTTAKDSSGNGNNGTLTNGPVWTKGKIGGAMNFDGKDDYAVIPDKPEFRGGVNVSKTIEAWFKISSNTAGQTIVAKVQDGTYKDYWIGMDYGNLDKIGFWSEAAGEDYRLTGGVVSLNQWHHVVVVIDRPNTKLRIYLDGLLSAEDAAFGDHSASTAANIGIGRDTYYSNTYLNGTIDEVRIYNRALSAEEVRYHYNRGGPVAEWKFDEGSGQKAFDSTENNNNGWLGGTSAAEASDPTWTAGKYGSALSFDGTDDYVDAGNNASLNITSVITVEAWVKPNVNNANMAVVGKWAQGADRQYIIYFGQDASNNKMGFYITQGGAGGSKSITPTTTFNANEWMHVVGVADGAYLRMFKNGIEIGTPTAYNGTIRSTTKNVFVGRLRSEDFIYMFNGSIDEVKIYNYARTPLEILNDYNNGLATHLR